MTFISNNTCIHTLGINTTSSIEPGFGYERELYSETPGNGFFLLPDRLQKNLAVSQRVAQLVRTKKKLKDTFCRPIPLAYRIRTCTCIHYIHIENAIT